MIITANNIMNRSVESYGAVKSRLQTADESGSDVRAEETDAVDAFRSGPVYPGSGLMKRALAQSSADKKEYHIETCRRLQLRYVIAAVALEPMSRAISVSM